LPQCSDGIVFGQPWPFMVRPGQADLSRKFVAQDIGLWGQPAFPAGGRVWVAGCGAFEAVAVALRFPDAQVVGSDLACESLHVCQGRADALGICNLELRHENINEHAYEREFDYVLCTGVIHHNADPQASLAALRTALKPDGLMELFVYNRYHRTRYVAFQQAAQMLSDASNGHVREHIQLGRDLLRALRGHPAFAAKLGSFVKAPDAILADTLLHPREHSYTVAELDELCRSRGLQILTFCHDPYSRSLGWLDWNLDLDDNSLRRRYERMSDIDRWHLTNLLFAEDSPRLHFYVQRDDSPRPRRDEREISRDFLQTRFSRVADHATVYRRQPSGGFALDRDGSVYPGRPPFHPLARKIYEDLEEAVPIGDLFLRLGIAAFVSVNRMRSALASWGCPYLLAS